MTSSSPTLTPSAGADALHRAVAEAEAGAVVTLTAGRYSLGGRPLQLTRGELTLAAAAGDAGRVVLSGGLRVLGWHAEPHSSLWRAPLPDGGSPRQLFIGGQRVRWARHPNDGYLRWQAALPVPFDAWGLTYRPNQGLERFGEALIGAHCVVFWSWTASRHVVTAHDPRRRMLLFDRPSHQALGAHLPQSGRRFFLEGFREALDAPNEFFAVPAGASGELLYSPPAALAAAGPESVEASVASAGLTSLLRVEGTVSRPVRSVSVHGIAFEHADWELPPPPEPADFQAAAHLREAALLLRHASDVSLVDVAVRSVGGYGVYLGEGVHRALIERCALRDLGAGGVRIGTETLEEARTGSNTLRHSTIMDGGHVYREGVGVLVQRSQANLVEECEIGHLGYTGISLGWEWGYSTPSGGGSNVVRRNFIHHIGGRELSDMGGIYVLGHAPGTLIEGNVIAHVASYHQYAWGVYLDEGASGVVVQGNLVHHTLSAGLHLHYGYNNSIRHNIFACAGSSDGELAISIGEGHTSWDFANNIVLRCNGAWRDSGAGEAAGEPSERAVRVEVLGGGGMRVQQQAHLSSLAEAEAKGDVEAEAEGDVEVERGCIYPAAPAWWLWWKGEGSRPNLRMADNIYFSLRDEDQLESWPPWLHFGRRGRTLRMWQKAGHDRGSMWLDPGFLDAARCAFSLRPDAPARAAGFPSFEPPDAAADQPGGGGSGGCGWPVSLVEGGSPWQPEPEAPTIPALAEGEALTADEVAPLVVGGAALLRRFVEQQQQPSELDLFRKALLRHATLQLGRWVSCWVTPSLARRERFIAGCTRDECVGYAKAELAAAACDALNFGCGGVTASAAAAGESPVYQTRAASKLRRSPADETSWLKRRCEADDDDDDDDGH